MSQSRTSRDGLVLVRDGLLARVPKHGVSWKGDYIDEGPFAGPRRVEGKVQMKNHTAWIMLSFLQCKDQKVGSLRLSFVTSHSEEESQGSDSEVASLIARGPFACARIVKFSDFPFFALLSIFRQIPRTANRASREAKHDKDSGS